MYLMYACIWLYMLWILFYRTNSLKESAIDACFSWAMHDGNGCKRRDSLVWDVGIVYARGRCPTSWRTSNSTGDWTTWRSCEVSKTWGRGGAQCTCQRFGPRSGVTSRTTIIQDLDGSLWSTSNGAHQKEAHYFGHHDGGTWSTARASWRSSWCSPSCSGVQTTSYGAEMPSFKDLGKLGPWPEDGNRDSRQQLHPEAREGPWISQAAKPQTFDSGGSWSLEEPLLARPLAGSTWLCTLHSSSGQIKTSPGGDTPRGLHAVSEFVWKNDSWPRPRASTMQIPDGGVLHVPSDWWWQTSRTATWSSTRRSWSSSAVDGFTRRGRSSCKSSAINGLIRRGGGSKSTWSSWWWWRFDGWRGWPATNSGGLKRSTWTRRSSSWRSSATICSWRTTRTCYERGRWGVASNDWRSHRRWG